jgi:hypothetical protein
LKSQYTSIRDKYQNEHEPSLSLEEARDILNKKEDKYTDEQVEEIRDFMEIIVDNDLLDKVNKE